MKLRYHSKRKENGAVAIVFGLTVAVLFAMGGVVLDLGHLYIAKAELQNAADAAALAGAKELKETAAGITLAVSKAQAIARKNKYNFSTDVSLASADIEFGPGPDGPWSTVATALASPAGKTFMKVDTGAKIMDTYLMRVAGAAFNTVNTFGVAVAGQYVNDITPMGVCAVDPANKTAKYTYPTGLTELVEYGFRRGVTYNIFGLNPLPGGPSDPYLINPVDAPPADCISSHSSANFTAPFMCAGSSAVIASGSGQVYANTGLTASLAASLNSRFDDYSPPSVCNPLDPKAQPDSNVQEYPCKNPSPSGDSACVNNAAASTIVTPPINWMEPGANAYPNQEAVTIVANKPNYRLPAVSFTPAATVTDAQFESYGVLWSYGPAYKADASTPPNVGTAFTPLEANLNPKMYSTAATAYFDTTSSANYPTAPGSGFPPGTPAAPYNQTSGPYFRAPSSHPPGVRNRRVLNLVLVDCSVAPVGPASCGKMNAVGVGKFFMQTKADFTGGSKKRLDVEFTGLIEPVPTSEIKLYR